MRLAGLLHGLASAFALAGCVQVPGLGAGAWQDTGLAAVPAGAHYDYVLQLDQPGQLHYDLQVAAGDAADLLVLDHAGYASYPVLDAPPACQRLHFVAALGACPLAPGAWHVVLRPAAGTAAAQVDVRYTLWTA